MAHGFVGGIVSLAGGGNFESGFLSGGVSSFAPEPVQGQSWEQTAQGTAQSAILGGVGSLLGGGKFNNGAITGAFGYLFNNCMHEGPCRGTAADRAYVKQEMQDCPGYGTCMDDARKDAIDAGIATDINRELLVWTGGSIGLGAAGAFGPAAGEWVYQNGVLVYRTADVLLNPVKTTAETFIELKPPAATLEDIPEVVSQTEKWLQSLARGFKPPPK